MQEVEQVSKKQIQRAKALREIVEIRGRLQTLKEQMEPLPYGLAEQVNICLHSLRILRIKWNAITDGMRNYHEHETR